MKIEKRNFLHFLSFLLAALMIFSLTPLSVYAADRSVTPKYDFSSVDDINIYDTYEKRETATGISYVRVTMNITPISTYLKRFLSFSDSSIPSQQHISDIKNYTLTQDVFSLKSSNDCKSSQTVYDIRTQLPSKCVLDDKISELESALRNNPDFADNKHREFISNPLGRELASTMILSDPDLQIQITEKMFGEVSKSSINSMLSMLQSHERELSNQVLCSFDSVMVEKAKTIGLTDTEKLLSIRYEQIDFASHATFNDKMASVLQDIKEAFDKEGLSFDSSKYF